ncbi:hypothetical protein Lal_00001020 [Lupinus albus]|nr:hypothetical protein Lal_00001020 [Lupinus albus]
MTVMKGKRTVGNTYKLLGRTVVGGVPRLSERFSPERERVTWEGEILGYTGGFSPERELSRLEKRENRDFQEQRALGLILELEKRVNMSDKRDGVTNENLEVCLCNRTMLLCGVTYMNILDVKVLTSRHARHRAFCIGLN